MFAKSFKLVKYFGNVIKYIKLENKHNKVKFSSIYSHSFLNYSKIRKSLLEKSSEYEML